MNPFSCDDFIIQRSTKPIVKDVLFEQKYRPVDISGVIGNKESIIELNNWINCKIKKEHTQNFAILYGPHGIGKTLITELLLEKTFFKIFELNSDIYPEKKELLEKLQKVLMSVSVQKILSGNKSIAIVIDSLEQTIGEGTLYTEFVDLLNKYPPLEIPVICISNSNKLKKKYDTPIKIKIIQLKPPTKEELIGFASNVLENEQKIITEPALIETIEACKYDIRKLLHYLKLYSLSSKKVLNEENIKNILKFSECDMYLNAYEIIEDFVKKKSTIPIETRISMCYTDQPLVVDLIYSNIPYLLEIPEIHEILSYLSYSDEIQSVIFKQHLWELRPHLICMSCIVPQIVILEKSTVKKNYIIKKNQLNCRPLNYIKNKNTFNEINNRSRFRMKTHELQYAMKNIIQPNIEQSRNPPTYIGDIIKYGLNFDNYMRLRTLQISNKQEPLNKKTRDSLEKTWYEHENLVETSKVKNK